MKIRLIRLLASLGGGCLLFLACADFDIWPLAYIGFLPPLLAIRGLSPGRAFFWGWICGTMASAGGFYWITHLLTRFGHMHWALSFALFLLMVCYQGLHFGLWAYLLRRIQRQAPALPMTLLAPVVMTTMELLMPFLFPWYLSITQAWVVPVIQVADLTGPLGVTFLLMMVNGLLYDLILMRLERRPLPLRPLLATVAVVAAVLVYGGLRIWQYDARWQQAPKIKVGMVQANVGIVEKGRSRLAPKHLQIHLDASRDLIRRGADLLIWPESSYPYAFRRSMTRDWPAGSQLQVMRGLTVPLFFGSLTYSTDPEDKYPYNTALMMEPDGRITGRFDKNFLLMFGEYIPFYDKLPSFKKWFPEASHFARGTEVTTFPFKDYRLGPMICYEDIIPSFGRRLARLRPHLLVNITNDAWFGATSEPHEHMALSVYRAVELRTGLVRSVNTGVTTVIDATGRVLAKTRPVDPALEPGVKPVTLLHEVGMLEAGHTVYAAVGEVFGYLNLAGTVALLLWAWRRSRRGPGAASPARKSRRKRRR